MVVAREKLQNVSKVNKFAAKKWQLQKYTKGNNFENVNLTNSNK